MSLDCFTDIPYNAGFCTFMWHIFKRNKFTDCHFQLKTKDEDRVLSAHKMLLSMWSPKFEDMFYGQEKLNNKVELTDVNPEAFEAMLKFMYGIDPILNSCEKVYELYKIAIEFEVTSLINMCQNFFIHVEVEVSNVFEVFEMAKNIRNKTLMDRCMKIIQDETKSIFSHYECHDVSPSAIKIILNSPKLSLDSEFELLTWMFAWAKNRYLECNEYSNLREVLYEFLPQLQILSLTHTEFATIYKHYNDFFDEKEAVSIFMNIAIRGSHPMPSWYTDTETRVYSG